MKIYNPSISKQELGGGHTFRRNLEKALRGKADFVDNWRDCDVYLITSVTIVDKSEVFEAKKAGKKVVLRVDNMPRKSRNSRMSPHERMKEFAQMADAVVYQSKWAQEWIGSYLGIEGKVIYNGVDTSIFKPPVNKPTRDSNVYMVVQYNRDENKRIPEALDMFSKAWMDDPKSTLMIVGRFSPELAQAGFDFFRGEKYEYYGVQDEPQQMAILMQQADVLLYPSYSDACPNTVIEAIACGMQVWHRGHSGVGEAASIEDPSLVRMGGEYLELFESL